MSHNWNMTFTTINYLGFLYQEPRCLCRGSGSLWAFFFIFFILQLVVAFFSFSSVCTNCFATAENSLLTHILQFAVCSLTAVKCSYRMLLSAARMCLCTRCHMTERGGESYVHERSCVCTDTSTLWWKGSNILNLRSEKLKLKYAIHIYMMPVATLH